MNTEELRIGYYYKSIIEFKESIKSGIDLTEDKVFKLTREILMLILEYNLKCKINRIPLTEEWLLKFGFKKINNSMFRLGALTIQWITINDAGDLYDKIVSSRKGIRICLNGKFICNQEFIHQLQNLYFALTGKELTIKK